jgi:hypothetical protein
MGVPVVEGEAELEVLPAGRDVAPQQAGCPEGDVPGEP